MMEMTLITRIVIFLALVLLCTGLMLYRRQARELARKTDELKEQKFKNKQARIIEELTVSLGRKPVAHAQNQTRRKNTYPHGPVAAIIPPAPHSGQQSSSPLNTPPDTPIAPMHGPDEENSIQPTFIVTPIQAPPLEPTTITNPIRTKEVTAMASLANQNSAGPLQSSPVQPVLSRLPSHQMNATENKQLNEQLNDHSLPKIITNHVPVPNAAPEPEASPQQSLLKSALSSLSRKPNEPAAPKLPRRRGNAVSSELKLNAEDNLYKHINDYAKWLVSQSPKFFIEHYEDGVPQENIPLIMNADQLERKNGHWIDLFRPVDLITTLKEHEGPASALYCPFTSQSVDQLKKPALQILAEVEDDPSPRYEQVIRECALNEFVIFLDDLKTITA